MTDRAKGCFVSFEHDIRVDDVEFLVNAIKMIKGVSEVSLNIADSNDWMNRNRIKSEIREKFLALYESLI